VRRPCSGMATLLRHISCRNYYYYYYLYVCYWVVLIRGEKLNSKEY